MDGYSRPGIDEVTDFVRWSAAWRGGSQVGRCAILIAGMQGLARPEYENTLPCRCHVDFKL
jgi:hypothetical protein